MTFTVTVTNCLTLYPVVVLYPCCQATGNEGKQMERYKSYETVTIDGNIIGVFVVALGFFTIFTALVSAL